MKEVVKKMIDHPIASLFLISEVTCGVARIILAIRGQGPGTIAVTTNNNTP